MKRKRGVQELLGAAGCPPAVTWRGKPWTVGFNTQEAKSVLEELIRQHVVRAAVRDKRAIGGEEGEAYFADVTARLDRGHYKTMEPGWWAVLQDATAGTPLLVLSLMRPAHPDLTLEDVVSLADEEPEQLQEALRVVAPDFFRHAARAARWKPEAVEKVAAAAEAMFGGLTSTASSGPTGS